MRTRYRDFRAVIRAVSLACRDSQIIILKHSEITCANVDKRKSMMSTMVARMVNRGKIAKLAIPVS